MIDTLTRNPELFFLTLPGLLMALVFHEWAHAWTADLFGDPTPRLQGRLTLDPRAHLDLLGTIVLLFAGFGWARPVQIQPHKFRNRFWGELVVYSGGVIMNILLAIVFSLLAVLAHTGRLGSWQPGLLTQAFRAAAYINQVLAAFNFIPVPPLDGYRVVGRLIPGFTGSRVGRFLDQFGMFFLVLLLVLGNGILMRLMRPIFVAVRFLVDAATGALAGLFG